FENGFQEFLSTYKSKFRRNLRRKITKANQQGELRLESITQYGELYRAFEVFLSVENSGWKGQKGTSIKQQPEQLTYFRSLLETYGKIGACQINLLYIGEICIAAQFSLLIEETLFLLKIGYDESYASISPGQLLILMLIESGCETGRFCKLSFVTGVSWIDVWKPKLNQAYLAYFSCGSFLGNTIIRLLRLRLWLLNYLKCMD
ncbi:MAG: GNAT family N-acetyltransferase, partial [Gammaproteobacteria bacterium]|nr:GNAT family N-acetyltransferase [Gammaproteobacteria bacterium]